jgi:hypothetical protein
VVAGVVISGYAVAAEHSRAELTRNYLRQNQHFGESLKSLPMPTTSDLFWSHYMDRSYAGALAGALGLEWPPPLRDDGGPSDKSIAEAYCSWNWRYCLLALTSNGWYQGRQTRYCLMDTTGHVGWTRDLVFLQRPAISDSGTAALFAQERDSLITTFVSLSGEVLGRWACPRGELITAKTGDQPDLGVFAFMPDCERLLMLINPRKKAPYFPDTARQYIRCLRTDGSAAWQHDLGESLVDHLAFPGDGRVIAFGSQERERSGQSVSRLFDSEFSVFNVQGDLICHIERRCSEEINYSWLVTYEPSYLYFVTDKIEVLDLHTGRMLTQVPLRPLYDELSKSTRRRSSQAEQLIRKELGLSMRDSIPPLR